MKKNNQKYLLPIGFYDLLDSECKINQESTEILLKKFTDFGYHLIKPPLVEFEEILGANKKLAMQSFKIVDIFSNKTLIIRSDITTQISRLLATRLQKENLPLRLCYVGDVLKIKNDDLYADRQLTQAGIELIGSDSVLANQEVIEIILAGIAAINLPNLLIDFCLPQFLEALLSELKINKNDDLKKAITSKNISMIRKLGGKFANHLITLTLEINDLALIKKTLSALPISKNLLQNIDQLQKIINKIKKNYPNLAMSVSIFGDEDFLYHQQIGFTIFEEGFLYPIARGGRYKINGEIAAVGGTIYMNHLRKILVGKGANNKKKIILLPTNFSVQEAQELHKQDYITVNSLIEDGKISEEKMNIEAKKLGCGFIFYNQKIKSVS